MRTTHLLATFLVLCTGFALAQSQDNTFAATAKQAVNTPAVDQFRISPYPQLDFVAQDSPTGDSGDRIHEDQYNPHQRLIELPPYYEADVNCYKIRNYRVVRDNRDSDSTHPDGYTTCVPAARFRLYTTLGSNQTINPRRSEP